MQDALKHRQELPTSAQPLPEKEMGSEEPTHLEAVEVIALGVTVLVALAGLAPVVLVVLFI